MREVKDVRLFVKVCAREREALRERAGRMNLSMSQLVRKLVIGGVDESERAASIGDEAANSVRAVDRALVSSLDEAVVAKEEASPLKNPDFKRSPKCTTEKCGRLRVGCCMMCRELNRLAK